jgi:hypothetical protein
MCRFTDVLGETASSIFRVLWVVGFSERLLHVYETTRRHCPEESSSSIQVLSFFKKIYALRIVDPFQGSSMVRGHSTKSLLVPLPLYLHIFLSALPDCLSPSRYCHNDRPRTRDLPPLSFKTQHKAQKSSFDCSQVNITEITTHDGVP